MNVSWTKKGYNADATERTIGYLKYFRMTYRLRI